MTKLALVAVVILAGCNLQGCTRVMAAFGVSAGDLAPSLKYCEKVQYERVETKIRVAAECTAPVGSL